jgi:hypothetical protein
LQLASTLKKQSQPAGKLPFHGLVFSLSNPYPARKEIYMTERIRSMTLPKMHYHKKPFSEIHKQLLPLCPIHQRYLLHPNRCKRNPLAKWILNKSIPWKVVAAGTGPIKKRDIFGTF